MKTLQTLIKSLRFKIVFESESQRERNVFKEMKRIVRGYFRSIQTAFRFIRSDLAEGRYPLKYKVYANRYGFLCLFAGKERPLTEEEIKFNEEVNRELEAFEEKYDDWLNEGNPYDVDYPPEEDFEQIA